MLPRFQIKEPERLHAALCFLKITKGESVLISRLQATTVILFQMRYLSLADRGNK